MFKILLSILSVLLIFSNSYAIEKNPYPIKPGEIGPIAPGELQYPFLCRTKFADLGDPVIDNDLQRGTPVKDGSGRIRYSEKCGSPMRLYYFYKPVNEDKYVDLPKDKEGHYYYPSDLDVTDSGDKYIVRVERGTINRFMYMIVILQDPVAGKTPQQSGYKNRAIFDFEGGTGVGYSQASNSAARIIKEPHRLVENIDPITLGYAILFTTGNATSTQYNLKLGFVTAQMVKKQLIAEFHGPKEPLQYTLAYGGSGGAVQQYVYAQLDPKHQLINGILALASYPDFITQTIYVSDCALLEYYFDNLAIDAPTPWAKRQLIEGFAASADMQASDLGRQNPKTRSIRSPDGTLGSDTCINGWGGAIPNVLNPHYPKVDGIDVIKLFHPPIEWSEWGSESTRWQFGTYPTMKGNITPNTVDNVGVQYGLDALKNGKIDKETFFDLNKKVGGWKPIEQFESEDGFPFSGPDKSYDGWSSKNATAATAFVQGKVAPRKKGDLKAINAAKESGTVLQGDLELPMIDVKADAEDEGNMHSTIHSFVTRARLGQHHKSSNQIIWIAHSPNNLFGLGNDLSAYAMNSMVSFSPSQNVMVSQQPTLELKPGNIVLKFMQDWVENIKKHPEKSVAENKPSELKDGCYYQDSSGPHLEFGDNVWDGIIDPTQKKGICAEHFDIHPTPRMVAGASFLGQTFKCQLDSVEHFIKKGGYGKIIMSDTDIKRLKYIFPNGVCN